MTGPEHYAEAERLLGNAATAAGDEDGSDPHPQTKWLTDAAQVHATLALAAATAQAGCALKEPAGMGGFSERRTAWGEVVHA